MKATTYKKKIKQNRYNFKGRMILICKSDIYTLTINCQFLIIINIFSKNFISFDHIIYSVKSLLIMIIRILPAHLNYTVQSLNFAWYLISQILHGFLIHKIK